MAEEMEPGIYDMPDSEYFAAPGLSQSGAKLLLEAPAKFRAGFQKRSTALDFGRVAHAMVLGTGTPAVVVDADSWRTKAAQEARAEAKAAGAVALLASEMETVTAMAAALRKHPVAAALLAQPGKPEQAAFTQDDETGVLLKGKIDLLPDAREDGRTILVDYKTAASADPSRFGKAAADYGYHIQAAWYQRLVREARGDADTAFVFVLQEKEYPYLVSCVELDAEAQEIGAALMRRAIDLYDACATRDEWPGYPSDITAASLPVWYIRNLEESL